MEGDDTKSIFKSFKLMILNEWRKQEKLCDFTLISEQTGDSIKVHKGALAITCPYFKSLFESKMAETEQESCVFKAIHLENELTNLVEYLYTGEICIPLPEVEFYYEHAQYYCLSGLVDICVSTIIGNINLDTCLDFWRIGVKFDNELVQASCFKHICKIMAKLIYNDSALHLTYTELKTLLFSDDICCSEDEVWLFIGRWLEYDIEHRKVHIDALIKEIRFDCMTVKGIDKVLTLELFQENKEILKFQKEILALKPEISSLIFNRINVARLGFGQKVVVAIYDKKIIHLPFTEYKKEYDIDKSANSKWKNNCEGTTLFAKNHLFLTSDNVECAYYNPVTEIIRQLPNMNICREGGHGITAIHDKIYCCGGNQNSKSVEIFDLEKGIWSDGTSMNAERKNFGIVTWENCIYAMGGCEKEIERYDPREGKWIYIGKHKYNFSYMRTIAFNNRLYGFTNSAEYMSIYDLRGGNWDHKKMNLKYFTVTNSIDVFQDEGKAHLISNRGGFWIIDLNRSTSDKVCSTYMHKQNQNLFVSLMRK